MSNEKSGIFVYKTTDVVVHAPRPLTISAEERATRLWLEALVAAGWTVAHRWWDEPPEGATKEEIEATSPDRLHMTEVTVDGFIDVAKKATVESYEFTGPKGASFSICGYGLCGDRR
jgi:hypothetical protein